MQRNFLQQNLAICLITLKYLGLCPFSWLVAKTIHNETTMLIITKLKRTVACGFIWYLGIFFSKKIKLLIVIFRNNMIILRFIHTRHGNQNTKNLPWCETLPCLWHIMILTVYLHIVMRCINMRRQLYSNIIMFIIIYITCIQQFGQLFLMFTSSFCAWNTSRFIFP